MLVKSGGILFSSLSLLEQQVEKVSLWKEVENNKCRRFRKKAAAGKK
jgi:hypothetical protein